LDSSESLGLTARLDRVKSLKSDQTSKAYYESPEQHLLNTPIKCKKLTHNVDPYRNMGLKSNENPGCFFGQKETNLISS
jgi:hypothetical protein